MLVEEDVLVESDGVLRTSWFSVAGELAGTVLMVVPGWSIWTGGLVRDGRLVGAGGMVMAGESFWNGGLVVVGVLVGTDGLVRECAFPVAGGSLEICGLLKAG